MKDIKYTRNKLSIIFTIILVLFFLLVGISFSIFKFFNARKELEKDFNEIKNSTINLEEEIVSYIQNNEEKIINYPFKESEELSIESILNSLEKDMTNVIANTESIKLVQNIPQYYKNRFPLFWQSFIFMSSNENINMTNISDYKYTDYKKYYDMVENIFFEEDKMVGVFDLNKYKVLVIIPLDYNLENLKKEIYQYIWVILALSIIIYLVTRLLISSSLRPVQDSIDSMNSFIHDAWHELKTPLAVINSSAGLLKEMKVYDEELVNDTMEELKRANKLIDTLRDLSNINPNKEKETFLLSSRIRYIAKTYKEQIKDKNIEIIINELEDSEITTNKYYFDILLANLISNAIKYNKQNGKIIINIDAPNISVRDTGIWIPKKELKKVFDRFYRVKSHRDKEWFGLWLSIVNKIIFVNKWNIELDSVEWEWTKITIWLK